MKVITIATKINKHLKRLIKSADHFGIPLQVLGKDMSYRDHNDKTIILLNYLKEVKDSEAILYLDGYDCIFLRDLNYIEEQFESFHHPFVISTEQNFNCDSSFPLKFFYYLKYPKGKSPYRFLNAGSWIAKADYATMVLEKVLAEKGNDQDLLNKFFALNHGSLALDYDHRIFTCSAGRTGLESEDYVLENGLVKNRVTKSFPAVFHAAGENFIGLSKVIKLVSYLDDEIYEERSLNKKYTNSKFINTLNARILPNNFLFHLLLKVGLFFIVGLILFLSI